MKKILLSLMATSLVTSFSVSANEFSGFSQAKSEAAPTVHPWFLELKSGVRNTQYDNADHSSDKDYLELDDEATDPLTILFKLGLGKEFNLSPRFTTRSRVSFGYGYGKKDDNISYFKDGGPVSYDYTAKNQVFLGEFSQSLDLNFYADNLVISPFVEFGIGTEMVKRDLDYGYSKDKGSNIRRFTVDEEMRNLYGLASFGLKFKNELKGTFLFVKGDYQHYLSTDTTDKSVVEEDGKNGKEFNANDAEVKQGSLSGQLGIGFYF